MHKWIAIVSGAVACACDTHADSVCQDIGYCRSLSDDQVQTCRTDAKQLATEAGGSGCSAQYDSYFACADDKYECNGNVPTFTGCEVARTALDTCLAQARAHNACGELEFRLAQCPGNVTGTPDPSTPPAPCGAGGVLSTVLPRQRDGCVPAAAGAVDRGAAVRPAVPVLSPRPPCSAKPS